jgi:hypothetical protein
MLIPVAIAVFLTSYSHPQDTEIRAYAAVLAHVHTKQPARGAPIIISNRATNHGCAPHCVDTVLINRRLSHHVVQSLKDKSLIVGTCEEPKGVLGCRRERGQKFVRLSIPYTVPGGVFVRPGHDERNPFVRSIDVGGERVDVAVDVLVYGPCLSERPCEYPDIYTYRYFLRLLPDGSYSVLARMLTGAV